MICLDTFTERAAILEYDHGMSRFAAETEAARRQGVQRWEAINEIKQRNPQGQRDQRAEVQRDAAHDVSRVQRHPAQQGRPMPERSVQAGRGGLELLALRMERR